VELSDAELAVAAADAGATVVRAKYGTPLRYFEKSLTDFATNADVEAEQAISDVLRTARPFDGLIGEEFGRTGETAAERSWLIDPLCGTLNFAARTPLFCVNVALLDGVDITVAAVAEPLSGELFWTDGPAAYVRHDSADEVLLPSAASRLVDVNLDRPSPNAAWFRAARLVESATFAESFAPRVSSTTLAVAWVAAGRRAGYVTDGDLRASVHFSSGIALCEAAGCVVTNLQGQPLHTGIGGLVVAANEQVHAVLIAAIDEQFNTATG
jgi:myo-inositol-1(or 4)-monophosphatase